MKKANKIAGFFRVCGFRKDNFKRGIIPYLIFTSAAVFGVYYAMNKTGQGKAFFDIWQGIFPVVYYAAVFTVMQEFIFRGILMPRLIAKYLNPFRVITINALIMACAYLAAAIFLPGLGQYKNFLILWSFPGGLVLGTLISFMYYNYPNIYLVTASVMAINYSVLIIGK